jgi:hypothetical protein
MEAAIEIELKKRGYEVFTSTEWGEAEPPFAKVNIDYSTFPSAFADRAWDHKVTIGVEDGAQHYGGCYAKWRGLGSDSIDSVLLALTPQALKEFPSR